MAIAQLDDQITLALSVKDRHASAAWYEQMLGFTLRMHIDEAGWSEMSTKTKGVVLGLGQTEDVVAGGATPVFGVPDIAAARTALEGAGVRFKGETQTMEGMVSLASFYDPDGNELMLAQDLSTQG